MTHYRKDLKVPRSVDYSSDDDDDDEVDDLDDEDEVDGYDGLTDYDELEYPAEFGKRDSYGNAHLGLDYVGNPLPANYNTDVRRHRSISEGCPRVLEHADDNRRDHHNHLERKRRASIKGSYNELREAIPGLRGSKASRAVTLQRAVEYIEELTKRNREHTRCVDKLTRQNELLDRQIHDLSRSCQLLEEPEYSDQPYLDQDSMAHPDKLSQSAGNACVNIRFVTAAPSRNTLSCVSNESLPVFRIVSHASSRPSDVQFTQSASDILHLTQANLPIHQEATHKTSIASSEHNSSSTSRPASTALSQPIVNSAFQKCAISNHTTLVPITIQNVPISSLGKRSHESSSLPIVIVPQSTKKKVYATLDGSPAAQDSNHLHLLRNNEQISTDNSVAIEVPIAYSFHDSDSWASKNSSSSTTIEHCTEELPSTN